MFTSTGTRTRPSRLSPRRRWCCCPARRPPTSPWPRREPSPARGRDDHLPRDQRRPRGPDHGSRGLPPDRAAAARRRAGRPGRLDGPGRHRGTRDARDGRRRTGPGDRDVGRLGGRVAHRRRVRGVPRRRGPAARRRRAAALPRDPVLRRRHHRRVVRPRPVRRSGAAAPRAGGALQRHTRRPAAPDTDGRGRGAPPRRTGPRRPAAGTGSPWWTIGLGVGLGALVAAGSAVLGRRQRRRFAAHGCTHGGDRRESRCPTVALGRPGLSRPGRAP